MLACGVGTSVPAPLFLMGKAAPIKTQFNNEREMKNNKERWVIVYTRTGNVPLVFHWHDESWTKQDALDKTKLSCKELRFRFGDGVF